MKILIVLACLLATQVNGQVAIQSQFGIPPPSSVGGPAFGPQDIWTNFTTGSGNITTTNIATGTAGSGNCTWTRNGTAASLTVGASQTALGGSVGPVAGTTYPSSTTTQTIAVADSDNTSAPYILCDFSNSGSIATWSGYITSNMVVAPTANELWDRVVITGTAGYAAAQIEVGQQCLANGGYGFNIETNPSGVTTHSPCIPIAQGATYWVNLQYNATSGFALLNVYNPINFALVGSTTVAQSTGGTVGEYRVGQNEFFASASTSYIEDSMINYTTHPFPITPISVPTTPRYVGQGTATSSVASGTTLAAIRTPASTSSGFIVTACTAATTGAITITDSQGNTYTQNTAPINVNTERCATSSKFGLASTAADTITATFGTTSTFRIIHINECTNCTAIDQNSGFVNHNSTTGGAVVSSSVTPTQQPELALAFFSGTNGDYTTTGWAPLSMENLAISLTNGNQINSLSAFSAAATDATGASGVVTNTELITIK